MTDRRSLLLGSAGSVLLSLAPCQIAFGAKMVNVRMWPAEEYTRVTLEHDAPLSFQHFIIRSSNPYRLVVDIKGLQLTQSLKQQIEAVKPNDPYIAGIRIGQFQPGIVRLVMDLKVDVKPEVFQLKPFGNYQYRLVFDLYPAHPTDEVGKILMAADDDTNDALGDLLGNLQNEPVTPAPTPAPAPQPKKPAITRPTEPARPKPPARKTTKRNPIVIVVDPGHGGEDPGAIGPRRTREKDVVLQISRRLVRLIDAEPDLTAKMTRNSDHFVSLGNRTKLAARWGAKIFVSVHADAWIKSSARGSSVWTLARKGATSADAKWLADSQNNSDLIGGVKSTDSGSLVNGVLADLIVRENNVYSEDLGNKVLTELKRFNRLHKQQIESANFAVLKGKGIASILVETAFISNPVEEQLLCNDTHQEKIARAILAGIRRQIADQPNFFSQG